MPTSDSPTVESIFVYPVKSCYRVQMQECEVDNLGIKYDRRFMIVVADSDNFITQRKHSSLTFLKPVLNQAENTLTLTAEGQEPLTLPLTQDLSKLTKRPVKLWKDNIFVFDVGDEAGEWITQFLENHRQHDDPNNERGPISPVRLVTLDNPKNGVYSRQAHPKLNGVHSAFTDEAPISFGFNSSLEDVNKGLLETGISQGITVTMNRFRNNINISGTIAWDEDQWLVAKVGEVTMYIVQPTARCPIPNIDQDTGIKDNWDGKILNDYLKISRRFAEEPHAGQFSCDVVPLTSGKIRVGDKIEILKRIPEEYKQGPLPPSSADSA